MASKKKSKPKAKTEAQKVRTARNKAKAQAREAARRKSKGNGASLALHLIRNRLKRIKRKLKEGVGADRVAKLQTRQTELTALLAT